MRRRLVRNTILVTVMVLLVLATPVILLLQRATEGELRSRLSAQASSISSALAEQLLSGDKIDSGILANLVLDGDRVEIRALDGSLLAAYGATIADSFHATVTGPTGTRIDVSTSRGDLRRRINGQLLLLGVLAAGGVLLAAVLAAIFGARVSRPLEQLAASAGRLGAGDFSAALPPQSGIREIDDIRSTLSASAVRLDQTLSSERSFTADASHQLRTGLTGIALRLELLATHADTAVRADALHALEQTDRLTATLNELLDLARGGRGSQRVAIDLSDLAAQHRGDWLQRYQITRRTLTLNWSPNDVGGPVLATPGFVGQIIDLLLDNALRHGVGDVSITLSGRQLHVSDQGRIKPESAQVFFQGSDDPVAPHGRGLALARRLAQADGGRLEISCFSPTTFTVSLPAAHDDALTLRSPGASDLPQR
jgi:signal transduction histidine kinase